MTPSAASTHHTDVRSSLSDIGLQVQLLRHLHLTCLCRYGRHVQLCKACSNSVQVGGSAWPELGSISLLSGDGLKSLECTTHPGTHWMSLYIQPHCRPGDCWWQRAQVMQ